MLCITGLLLCAAAKIMLEMELSNRFAAPLGLAAFMVGTAGGTAVFACCSKKKSPAYGLAIGAFLWICLCAVGLIAGQQTFTLHSVIRLVTLCCAGAFGSVLGGNSTRRLPC